MQAALGGETPSLALRVGVNWPGSRVVTPSLALRVSRLQLKDYYNFVEPFIWYVVAVLSVPALRQHATLPWRLALAGVVGLFGTSDFYEKEAWWTPWWLLAWKAACLIAMAAIIARIYVRSASKRGGPTSAEGNRDERTNRSG